MPSKLEGITDVEAPDALQAIKSVSNADGKLVYLLLSLSLMNKYILFFKLNIYIHTYCIHTYIHTYLHI